MIVNNEPYLIEYNVRMGDPECQTILPKLKFRFIRYFFSCCDEKLMKLKLNGIIKKVYVLFYVQKDTLINLKKIIN